MFRLRDYQITLANRGLDILAAHGLAYNISEERTGKTASTLYLIELTKMSKCLIITKKAAIADFNKEIANMREAGLFTKEAYVVNYESVHKVDFKPDIVILDEAHHALSAYPKPGKIMQIVGDVVWGLPIVYMSATPHSESYSQLYHQLRLSTWSPFREYKNFYAWHRAFGVPDVVYLGRRSVPSYKKTREDLIKPLIDPLCYGITRAEAGFTQEAEDVPIFVELTDRTTELLKQLGDEGVIQVGQQTVVAESAVSVLTKQHQLEGGTMKIVVGQREIKHKNAPSSYVDVHQSFYTGNTEKIDYILDAWGDVEDLVIMYHYQEEEHLLKDHFSKATILQADRFAEGISLKQFKSLVIYSMSWRTSKFIQRRSRQADKERTEAIKVYYLLARDQISHFVYDSVAVKRVNFNTRMYNSY